MDTVDLTISFRNNDFSDLIDDLRSATTYEEFEVQTASSIDGALPEMIIALVVSRQSLIVVKEIIIARINQSKVTSIKLGDLQANDADRATINKMFELYEKSQLTASDDRES